MMDPSLDRPSTSGEKERQDICAYIYTAGFVFLSPVLSLRNRLIVHIYVSGTLVVRMIRSSMHACVRAYELKSNRVEEAKPLSLIARKEKKHCRK